jgi:hypothetical protein
MGCDYRLINNSLFAPGYEAVNIYLVVDIEGNNVIGN